MADRGRYTPPIFRFSAYAYVTDTPAIPAARFGVSPDAIRSAVLRSRSGAIFRPSGRSAARAAIAARRAASRGTPLTRRSSLYANATDTPAIPAARFGVSPDPIRPSKTRRRSAATLRQGINTIP